MLARYEFESISLSDFFESVSFSKEVGLHLERCVGEMSHNEESGDRNEGEDDETGDDDERFRGHGCRSI